MVFEMAFRARKVYETFEKRAPEPLIKTKGIWFPLAHALNSACIELRARLQFVLLSVICSVAKPIKIVNFTDRSRAARFSKRAQHKEPRFVLRD